MLSEDLFQTTACQGAAEPETQIRAGPVAGTDPPPLVTGVHPAGLDAFSHQ